MIQQLISQDKLKIASLIQKKRAQADLTDTAEFQKKRLKFLNQLNLLSLNLVQVYEMYRFQNDSGHIKTKSQIPNYFQEIKYCNSRKQIFSELRAECDKLPLDKSIDFICEICLELIKKEFHFAVFYAEGQRSPHVIIYDFFELEKLNSYQRTKARAKFWRWLIPFRMHLLDAGIWSDEQLVPIEFGMHFKYGTPFNLIFEYLPKEKEKCN